MIDYTDFSSHLRDRGIEESACIFLVVSKLREPGVNPGLDHNLCLLPSGPTSLRMFWRGLDLLASLPRSRLLLMDAKHNQVGQICHLLPVGAQPEHRFLKVCLMA